jgi:membrane-bound lytic murein transglycosylase F
MNTTEDSTLNNLSALEPEHSPITEHSAPPGLQHWQVLEIEGEATVIDQPDDHEISHHAVIDDHVDDVIVATMAERNLAVHPGGVVTLAVGLLNNGAQPALFRVYVEGWIDEQWLIDGAQHVSLRPGERATVRIALMPPRRPTTTAGEHALALVVRSPEYPRRWARIGATLLVHPYTEFGVGRLQPASIHLGWLKPRAVLTLPVTNLSNRTVTFQLHGQSAGCSFEFHAPGATYSQPNVAHLPLDSQQSTLVRVVVTPHTPAGLGVGTVVQPLNVAVGVLNEPRMPRMASAELHISPLLKLWHGVAITGALLMTVALVVVLMMASQVALRLTATAPVMPAVPAAAVPPVVIVLNQVAPTPSATTMAARPPAERAPIVVIPNGPVGGAQVSRADPRLPLVSANQITAPGEAAAVRSVAPPPAAAPGAGMTYAQMFQDVALQYDLDWRLLAAQAYVESAFDSLALGSQGDMGLMQVIPSTWREWAPVVGVNDPFDAYSNTLVAATYLDHLRSLLAERGYSQAQWMLVAYNWGPDKLLDFLAGGGAWEQLPEERQKYAADILGIARTIP